MSLMGTVMESLELLPYQSAFAANNSRFKIGLWARQTGKDHTATAEAVIDCLEHPGTTWIILAASERQALESLAKAKDWAEILKFRIDEYIETPGNLPLSQARATSTEIRWSNGSRLLALPANPQTVRGYSANLILTEFAFHENPEAIWRAIYPSISNPLRGCGGGLKKLRIISTPNGLTNKFPDLWFNTPGDYHRGTENTEDTENILTTENAAPSVSSVSSVVKTSGAYFKSRITIHDAIASGLPLDADELRAGLNDEEAWSQEYLCEFMDSSTVMFPYDLIAPCESEQATELLAGGATVSAVSGPLYAGIDFGRKHHLTVCWILERLPLSADAGTLTRSQSRHIFVTREVLTIKNTSTPEQIEILRPRLQRCRKICLDYTGAGVGFGDYLVREFGEQTSSAGASLHPRNSGGATLPRSQGKVELCQFTSALKSELFPRLRAAFEHRLLRIPISREIREDLHAVQRAVTQSGQITYRAPNTADGHSDRTTALALALRAASSVVSSGPARSIAVPGRTANLRWCNRLRARGGRAFAL